MLQRLVGFGIAAGLLLSLVPPGVAHAELTSPSLIISELQTTGYSLGTATENGAMEFIELYNMSSMDLTVTGWKVQYVVASSGNTTDLFVFDGSILANSYVLLAHISYLADVRDGSFISTSVNGVLAKSGNYVQIVDAAGVKIDRVGWGNAPRDTWLHVGGINADYSVKRVLPGHPLEQTGILYTPATQPTTPIGGGYVVYVPEIPEEPDEEPPVGPVLSCEGIVLSEVFPNPAGTDTGHEFIELYNPTNEVIDLAGCALHTSGSTKSYVFGSESLEPWTYRAVSDVITGLILPNSSGATIWLLTADQVEVSTATYPGGMEDDTAWALIDGVWQLTYAPTPGVMNQAMPHKPCPSGQERSIVSNRCVNIVAVAADVTPCKAGQERNLDTNRCRAVGSISALTPCKEGQERNPETNRCRAVASAATSLKPCAADQERNPDTNRCRKVASASTLAQCKEDQERNPETNRCRKIAQKSSDVAAVSDVESSTEASKTSWYITGVVVFAALAYAIYEWRQDILLRLKNFGSRR